MNRLKTIIPLLIVFASCGQPKMSEKADSARKLRSSLHELPIQPTLDKYKQLLHYSNDYAGTIAISTSSIKLLSEKEALIPGDFELFKFRIENPDHFEYGRIICLALVSKYDSTDVRILFPRSYAENSINFFEPYLNKLVTNKKSYCTDLSNLITNIITEQTKDVQYQYLNGDDRLTVISKYFPELADKDDTTNIVIDSVLFTFNIDTLKSLVKLNKYDRVKVINLKLTR